MLPQLKSEVALSAGVEGISKGTLGRLLRITDWPALADQARYNVGALARSCGLSVRQLQRFFKNYRQQCPKQFLRRFRMVRAIELLCEDLSVKEVADRLYFHDAAHFSKRFSAAFSVPPALVHSLSSPAFRQQLLRILDRPGATSNDLPLIPSHLRK